MNTLINCTKARFYALQVKSDLFWSEVWEQVEIDAKSRKSKARQRAIDHLSKSAECVMAAAFEVAGAEF